MQSIQINDHRGTARTLFPLRPQTQPLFKYSVMRKRRLTKHQVMQQFAKKKEWTSASEDGFTQALNSLGNTSLNKAPSLEEIRSR